MSTIVFRNVKKSYGEQEILSGLSMTVKSGRGKIILGAGGSGKTTILKMVLGLVVPDSGEIMIDDKVISSMTEDELMPFRSRTGMVFQEGALFDSLTVIENVSYRLIEHTTLSKKVIREQALQALGFVGLENSADRMPSELSGGMKRRVGIARAMVGNPKIILYDEPTAGLDPITGRTICNLIMGLRDIRRITSVMVTNDLDAARIIATEKAIKSQENKIEFIPQQKTEEINTDYLVLCDGKIRLEGTQEDLRNSDDSYIREFLD